VGLVTAPTGPETDARIARLTAEGHLDSPPEVPTSGEDPIADAPGHQPDDDAPVVAVEVRSLPTVDLAELARKGVEALAYWWALDLLAQGLHVLVVDVEAGPEQVTEKLLALGADPISLARLTYVHYPGARWDAARTTSAKSSRSTRRFRRWPATTTPRSWSSTT
jgi:hypothetical protein